MEEVNEELKVLFRIREENPFWVLFDDKYLKYKTETNQLNKPIEKLLKGMLQDYVDKELVHSYDIDLYRAFAQGRRRNDNKGFSLATQRRIMGLDDDNPKIKRGNPNPDVVDLYCHVVHGKRYYDCVIEGELNDTDPYIFEQLQYSKRSKVVPFDTYKQEYYQKNDDSIKADVLPHKEPAEYQHSENGVEDVVTTTTYETVKKEEKKGINLKWAVFAFISILGFTAFYFIIPFIKNQLDNRGKQAFKVNSTFDMQDTSFKVLILPFDKECLYKDTNYDIGKVIYYRLQALDAEDTLHLTIRYLANFTDFANFSSRKADSILEYYHYDQLIYGIYSLKGCEGGGHDKVCFNYNINKRRWHFDKRQVKSDYKMVNIDGLDAIRNGAGQEEIDYIIYLVAGLSEKHQGNSVRAIHKFQKIKDYEANTEILWYIAQCYIQLKDYREENAYFKKILKIDPQDEAAWLGSGVMYMALKEDDVAIGRFEQALKIDSTDERAWLSIGTIYKDAKKYDAAKIYLDKSLYFNNSDVENLKLLAESYQQLKDTSKELESLQRILTIAPEYPHKYHVLGKIFSDLKNDSQAKVFYKKELELYPDDSGNLVDLALSYYAVKDYKNAEIIIEKLLKYNPDHEGRWELLGYMYRLSNDTIKAKECDERALKLNPKDVSAWDNLGDIYFFGTENYNVAKKYYEKVIEISPNRVLSLFKLGGAYYKLEEYSNACSLFNKGLKINSKDETAWRYLGKAYSHVKKYSEAERCLKKSLEFPTDSGLLWYEYNMAAMNCLKHDKSQALLHLRKAIGLKNSTKSDAKSDKDFAWLKTDNDFIQLTN